MRSGRSRFKFGDYFWIVVVVFEDCLFPRFFCNARLKLVLDLAVVDDMAVIILGDTTQEQSSAGPPPVFLQLKVLFDTEILERTKRFVEAFCNPLFAGDATTDV